MADAIPGFSDEEARVLRDAQQRGLLSREQQQEIIRRSGEAGEGASATTEPVSSKPTSLPELTGGVATRGLFIGAGAVGGTALGMVTAPATGPVGPIVGGGLGTAAGTLIFDTTEDVLNFFGLIDRPDPSIVERTKTAITEVTIDLAFAGVGAAVRPILGSRRLLAKMFGVLKPEAQALRVQAEMLGIELGAVDVGGGVPKTFAKAVSIFPLTGTPLKRAFVTKQTQALVAAERILDELAPNSTMAGQLGINMGKAARNTSDEFKRVAGVLYDNFDDLAAKATTKEIVPTDNVRKVVGELTEEIRAGRIFLKTSPVRTLEPSRPRLRLKRRRRPELVSPLPNKVQKFVKDINKLPDAITIQQYRRLTRDFGDIMRDMTAAGTDVRRATIIKDALEVDLNNLRVDLLPAEEGKALREALGIANTFYAKGTVAFQKGAGKTVARELGIKADLPQGFRGKREFETATARQFERVDKRFFGAGAPQPGTLNEDELARVALNLKSAKAVGDLERLVGRKVIRQAARQRVESAYLQSLDEVSVDGQIFNILNPKRFLSSLGLEAADKGQREALEALLRRGGVKLSDLEDLAAVVKRIEDIGDTSNFVKRRVILGGARGGLIAAAGFGGAALASGTGASIPTALVPVVALTTAARMGSSIIAKPQALRNLITALDEARATTARRAALARLVRFVTRDEEQEGSEAQASTEPIGASALAIP